MSSAPKGPQANDRVRALVEWVVKHSEQIGTSKGENVSLTFDMAGNRLAVSVRTFDRLLVDEGQPAA